MLAGREVLEACVVAGAGVGLRFAARDQWLAAKLAESAFVKRVLLVQTAEEYQRVGAPYRGGSLHLCAGG